MKGEGPSGLSGLADAPQCGRTDGHSAILFAQRDLVQPWKDVLKTIIVVSTAAGEGGSPGGGAGAADAAAAAAAAPPSAGNTGKFVH